MLKLKFNKAMVWEGRGLGIRNYKLGIRNWELGIIN
jgi:hypothetical protein